MMSIAVVFTVAVEEEYDPKEDYTTRRSVAYLGDKEVWKGTDELTYYAEAEDALTEFTNKLKEVLDA